MVKRVRADSAYASPWKPVKKFAFQAAGATLGYIGMNEIGAYAGWKESGKWFEKLTQMPGKYQGYEGLPDGIGSDNKTINLGGRITANHVGAASWRTQYTGVLSTVNEVVKDPSGADQSGLTSGIQSTDLIGACMTIWDFTKGTKSAPALSRVEPYINLFAMNPDSIATGSVDSGGVLIPSLSWSQDYINWYSTRFIIDLSNGSSNAAYVKIYVCKSKKDQNVNPEEAWNYDDQSFGQTNFRMNTVDAVPQHAVLDRHQVHCVPQSSTRFRQQWDIIGMKSCRLASGGDCKININIKVNRTYSRQAMLFKVTEDADVLYPKGSVALMAVAYGGLVNIVTDPGPPFDGPAYGVHQVLYGITKIYNFGFTDKTDKYNVAWQGNYQPTKAPLATQHLMLNGSNEIMEAL